MKDQHSQRGAALAVTLMILSLASFLAVQLLVMSRQSLATARSRLDQVKAEIALDSAVTLTIRALELDDDMVDHLGEAWSLPRQMQQEGLSASVAITDEDSKLNLNGLLAPGGDINERRLEQLERLLDIIGCNGNFISPLLDWLDPDEITRPGGFESDFYLRRKPSYASKNGLLDQLGELEWVQGGSDLLHCAHDFITVFSDNMININTAPAAVLRCLSAAMTEELALAIIRFRTESPFNDISELSQVPGMTPNAFNDIARSITVRSHFFSAVIEVADGAQKSQMRIICERTPGKARVVSRQRRVLS